MIHRIVLDVELLQAEPPRQPVGANQRRIARVKSSARLTRNWQQLSEPPHIPRPPFDDVATHRLANRAVVVLDLQRSQTLIADPQRLGGKLRPAQMTLKARHKRHAFPSLCTRTVLTVHAIRSLR